ncbi:hypothetical protein SUGI_1023050 [Cryptomeria japonica]|uniref:probable mitochondrial import inner membrane translocase subunit TIM21 isoform X2 n=1 Tax=Cryptomeria japonica TaxID=3369 RepID=UPI002414B547|nr:probable mitochondrial import inner membrane translocase subunit TIM21 isoform X2 [Cryptomeria japonica]GLJ48467.1 hypothetical protein SUGI_1023050 [Cryptomeria japonica]
MQNSLSQISLRLLLRFFFSLDKQFKERRMKRQVWRSASSQIFKELKRCRPDVRLSSNVLPGFSSQLGERIGSAHGVEVNYRNKVLKSNGMHWMFSFSVRTLASSSATESNQQTKQEKHDRDVAKKEDPFDPLTDQIPEQPVTFAEGASYSLVILAGLAVAAGAAYAVFKELIFEPKEYKIFGKALERVQSDSQVKVRIGSPITGYGHESRNRAARQRIPHRKWSDEDGVERVEVNFYVRGPHGAGKVYSEMFKDKTDKNWKFTYLIVDVTSPTRTQLMLESYVPA